DDAARSLYDFRNLFGRVFETRAIFGRDVEMNFGRRQPVLVLQIGVQFDVTFRRRNHAVLRIQVDQSGESPPDPALEVRAEAGDVVGEAGIADAKPRAGIDDDVITLRKIRMWLLPVERRDVRMAALGAVVGNHVAAYQRFQIASGGCARMADQIFAYQSA